MEKYKKIEKKYWKASGLYVLAMLGGTGFVIMPWYQPVGIIFYFVVILGAGTVYLFRWLLQHAAYECPKCNRYFKPSTASAIMSLNNGFKKLLTCPVCGENSWCRAIDAASVSDIYHETSGSGVLQQTHEVRDSYYKTQIGIVIAFYTLLWFTTIALYYSAPETIPTHIGITGIAWGDKSTLFWIPFIALPILFIHAAAIEHARKRRMRDALYTFLTWITVKSLLIFIGVQFLLVYLAD